MAHAGEVALASTCHNGNGTTIGNAALPVYGHWSLGPDHQLFYSLQAGTGMQLPGPGTSMVGDDIVRATIQEAGTVWNQANCCTSGTAHPNLELTRDADFSASEANPPSIATTGAKGKHPIWVNKGSDFGNPLDFNNPCFPGTLAITVPSRNGAHIISTAMMVFGGWGHDIQDGGTCDPDGPGGPQASFEQPDTRANLIRWYTGTTSINGAFSLKAVAIHELGHFIGYDHSECVESVMYKSYKNPPKLDLHATDRYSVCASPTYQQGYGHATACPTAADNTSDQEDVTLNNGMSGATGGNVMTQQGRYGQCSVTADCLTGLTCRTWPNGQKACDWPCAVADTCPQGQACVSGYCKTPSASAGGAGSGTSTGATGGTGPQEPADAIPTQDFCAPCGKRDDCLNSLCVRMGTDTTPFCSATCEGADDCGPLATCTSTGTAGIGVCVPKDVSCIQKAVARRGQLNESCSTDLPCGPGLLCVQLANQPVCLEYCDTDSGGKSCTTSGYSCFELDKERKYGVCFKATAREGESCLLPDTSLCGFADGLQCFGTPAKQYQDAACYKLCGGKYGSSCATGQNCVTNQGATVGVCTPLVEPTCPLADFGQKCSKADDCTTGYCANSGSDSACSRSCDANLNSGCPNNFTCRSSGGANGYCWPTSNTVTAAPICKSGPGGCPPAASGQGCEANNGDIALVLLAFASLVLVRRRRRV
ncbi:MAG: matrixin family metalloprotease [Deltaproteobacteria bacterium]|nr:matrixin family metalloprotease [Deltaproteobacteria bacterium]